MKLLKVSIDIRNRFRENMRLKFMGYRQAVRQRVLISSCAGSNPAIPAILSGANINLRLTITAKA
jgi:hypothetical protein